VVIDEFHESHVIRNMNTTNKLMTTAEAKQHIATHPTDCWYVLVRDIKWTGQADEIRKLIDSARPKCGYNCHESSCPVSGKKIKLTDYQKY
jgi:hypothetical protein